MRPTFVLIKTILLILLDPFVILSFRCPANDVVKPCTCSDSTRKLICIKYDSNDFNSNNNLKKVLERISNGMSPEDGPFSLIMIVNTQSLTFEENLFSNLTFEELFVFEYNLTKIHSNIFEKTYSSLKKVYMNLYSLKENQQNYSLLQALNSLENLQVLQLDFGLNSIITIPDFAFNSNISSQNNLTEISINGRIESVGQYAFAQLPNLRFLRILDEIQSLGEHSLEFESDSSQELEINLSYNKLTGNGFAVNSLSNIRRAVNLILTDNRIKYLDESVFNPFFDANNDNKLVLTKNLLDCTDCRNFWTINKKSNLINRIIDPICSSGQSIWDYIWMCTTTDTHSTNAITDSPSTDTNTDGPSTNTITESSFNNITETINSTDNNNNGKNGNMSTYLTSDNSLILSLLVILKLLLNV